MATVVNRSAHADFRRFATETGARVERALVAAYGIEVGTEAAAEALAVAWERWEYVTGLGNPAGFLYRVGQSRARPHLRWARRTGTFPSSYRVPAAESAEVDAAAVAELFAALARLTRNQRVAVVLVRMYGFSYGEAAAVMSVSEAAVTNHIHRGMALLRQLMGVQR